MTRIYSKVAIAGCAKNISKDYNELKVAIYNFCKMFHEYASEHESFRRDEVNAEKEVNAENEANITIDFIVVSAKSSTDNTEQLLTQIGNEYLTSIYIIPENLNHIPYSSIRLSICRNEIVKRIFSESKEPYDYLLMVDLDNAITDYTFNMEGIKSCLRESDKWDALSCLYIPYYDWFALRKEGLNVYNQYYVSTVYGIHPNDTISSIAKSIEDITAKEDDTDYHEYLSAFSGCTLYKVAAIKDCVYSSQNKYNKGDVTDCEHFNFHIEMKEKNGGRLMINRRFNAILKNKDSMLFK